MAESRSVAVVPLNGSNYPTWKVQCRMALMKDGLWNIVNGTETAPSTSDADRHAKFVTRRDRALATIVLSVEPSLLYLIGDPEDPIVVWQKLANQFEKKTWANKLNLRRRLHSLRLKDGDPVQEHVKAMTEIFDSLSVVGDPVSDEDRVVHLLASLPDSYNVLVTALEASEDVPKMEVVTERLLHEEQKLKDRAGTSASAEKAMNLRQRQRKKVPRCHHCGKPGHFKRNCRELSGDKQSQKEKKGGNHKTNMSTTKGQDSSSSDSEVAGLVVNHALSTSSSSEQGTWIVDSGATCHMCRDRNLFTDLHHLQNPLEVALGDGRTLTASGKGKVKLHMELPNGKTKTCMLSDVLYVPKLSNNLLSVAKAAQKGKVTKFTNDACYVLDKQHKLIAKASKVGSLYYLNHQSYSEEANSVKSPETKEDVWHRRFGHLGLRNLQRLSRKNLVDGFDYDASKELTFCEPCVEGKQHRNRFPSDGRKRAEKPLDLVHSDLCGKMNAQSLSGAEYFLTFIDDKTHYVWVYILKSKDLVFKQFLEWKAMVEKSTGRKLKTLRTDNGGEFTSREFDAYLKAEGVRHELTVPKTPEQNGVAERMNRTLMEAVRSMLSGAKLPHKFWAEALSTATYLLNRSPTKAVKGMTPYEAWTGEKPLVEHLRVFGCQAYAQIPKDERKKLNSKTRKCILMGYGTETKGYRLYDPHRQKVFFSRNVVFNERECGLEKEHCQPEQERYVNLELSNDEDTVCDDHQEQVLRRSERERRPPNYYGVWTSVTDAKEPATVNDALSAPDKTKWLDAMETEIDSLHKNDVWDLVELPKDRKAVGSKWVFKVKVSADGSVERYKARLVAQGYSQKYGIDYDEIFCPVVRSESIRTVIALAAQNGLQLHQMDVTSAFLNGDLEEEVYMKQPEGFTVKGKEHLVCKLKRSIYGLKQSPRCWNQTLDTQLKKMGFIQSTSDPCIYTSSKEGLLILAVYVDDIVLAGKSEKQIKEVKTALAKLFQVKDMGEMNYFLGVSVKQNPKTGETWIGQPLYTQSILRKFGMENARSIRTPVDPSTKLLKATDGCEMADPVLYQSAVGSLLYLSNWTRPDITYAVSSVARFCTNPTKQHWIAVKRIMRYLKGTPNHGLMYSKGDPKSCMGYSDADWAGDVNDRKSTSGYLFKISGAPVSWRSKKQSCVALSTAEAEYMALSSAAQEATWIRQLTSDLQNGPTRPTVIHEDNQAAICMAKNPQFHGRTKHIEIKYHFIREKVQNETIELKYCATNDMIADMLTKGLCHEKFEKFRELAGVKEMKNQTDGK